MPGRPLDTLRELVGETRETVRNLRVERGIVAEFARAIGDPASIYTDPDAAREAGYPAIPAPPTFTRVAYFPRYRPDGVGRDLGFDLGFEPDRVVHGEQEYEYERPIYVGDVLSGETTLLDVYQKTGGGGTLTFAELETSFFDADGDRVQVARNTRIETPKPDGSSDG